MARVREGTGRVIHCTVRSCIWLTLSVSGVSVGREMVSVSIQSPV